MSATQFPLVAVDVGNSRVKFGLFTQPSAEPLPRPHSEWNWTPGRDTWDALDAWLAPYAAAELHWWIGSVQRQLASELIAWLRARQADQIVLLASGDLPLTIELPRPDMVGIDRLLGAVAANRLRPAGRPAVVVDLGTAITVDLVSAAGAFAGGAILPGIGLSARGLYEFTDLLPLLEMQDLAAPPPVVGLDTIAALRSGIYWGAVGGVREVVQRLRGELAVEPQVYLTGGAAPSVAPLIAADAAYVPHLVLGGIALTAEA